MLVCFFLFWFWLGTCYSTVVLLVCRMALLHTRNLHVVFVSRAMHEKVVNLLLIRFSLQFETLSKNTASKWFLLN